MLAVALAASPYAMLAQRGAGGGHTGGSLAGGGGLSGGGKATGIDEKDDLKSFHAALAVQATSQQIVAYTSMVKSTDAANQELQNFMALLAKPDNRPELAARNASLAQAIEKARTENRRFLDGFSDRQKSGLKEISKKLIKEDGELAQQARALGAVSETSSGQPIAASAQNLANALTAFRSRQIDLGEEMNIGALFGENFSYNISARTSTVNFANQPVGIVT
jgi:hypothetical protein